MASATSAADHTGSIASALAPASPAVAATAPTTLYVAQDGADTNRCVTKMLNPVADQPRDRARRCRQDPPVHILRQGRLSGDRLHPASKHVTVDRGRAPTSTPAQLCRPSNDIDGQRSTTRTGVLTLKSMGAGQLLIGIRGNERGALNTSHVRFALTTCPLYISGGRVTLTDSVLDSSGSAAEGPNDCAPTATSPVAVTLNGGSLSLVRSRLTDTKGEPGSSSTAAHSPLTAPPSPTTTWRCRQRFPAPNNSCSAARSSTPRCSGR